MGQNMWGRSCALVAALAVILSSGLAAGQEAKKSAEKPKRPSPSDRVVYGDAERRIERVLDQQLKTTLRYVDIPLNIVLQELSEQYDIPIVFDEAALEAVASSPDVEVSLSIANTSLRSALKLLLRSQEDLTYMVDDEVLLITTEEEEQRRLEIRVYRVDDLHYELPQPAGAVSWADYNVLIGVITDNVEPRSWRENGTGDGEITFFHPSMLVISQTRRVHVEIERMLDSMRQTKAAINAAEAEAATGKPITDGFPVNDSALTDTEEERAMIEEVLLKSVDWSPGDVGLVDDQVFIHVLPTRVIVRHAPRVVEQVGETIRKISATSPNRGGRGGGSDLAEQPTSSQDGRSGRRGYGRGGGF